MCDDSERNDTIFLLPSYGDPAKRKLIGRYAGLRLYVRQYITWVDICYLEYISREQLRSKERSGDLTSTLGNLSALDLQLCIPSILEFASDL